MKLALYKGTRPGWQGFYSRVVRWLDDGPYSHCEIVFSDGVSASSSYIDGGVRFKIIDYDTSHWDFMNLPNHLEPAAREWFRVHNTKPYDIWGNIRFVFGFARDSRDKWFCSEAAMSALGFKDAYRYGPNGMTEVLAVLADPKV